tara:strand:- start:41 stop:352 length:312 start_codon:yes stop_codon:yes gene_type:complete
MTRVGGIAMLLGAAVLLWPYLPTGSEPVAGDCLSASYAADRTARVAMLREMAGKEFASDAEQAEWHNAQSRRIISESFAPYIDAAAEAMDTDTEAEFAERLAR